jgi:hypothetical protein
MGKREKKVKSRIKGERNFVLGRSRSSDYHMGVFENNKSGFS